MTLLICGLAVYGALSIIATGCWILVTHLHPHDDTASVEEWCE